MSRIAIQVLSGPAVTVNDSDGVGHSLNAGDAPTEFDLAEGHNVDLGSDKSDEEDDAETGAGEGEGGAEA